jgi:hypothetical protein
VTSGSITVSEGTFVRVTNVTTESAGGSANVYSLQLATNSIFGIPACNGGVSGCRGEQHFIYSSSVNGGVLIRHWLYNYFSIPCPTGWQTSGQAAQDCFKDSSVMPVPAQPITSLRQMTLTGTASLNGMDTAVLSTGNTLYMVSDSDSVLNLAGNWKAAEFNIYGDGLAFPQATFNGGATLVVKTSVSNGTTNAPSCVTDDPSAPDLPLVFETNNLTLEGSCCPVGGASPGIIFAESDAPGAAPACSTLKASWLPPVLSLLL